jgi:DNA transformation protein
MSIEAGLLTWVEEALEPMGKVSLRRMMGGATLYLDGIIFAIMHGGELWFKADAESDAIWDEAGHSERFSVVFKDGSVDMMNYRRAPADVHDDAEAMQRWTRLALEAGMRRKTKKPKTKRRQPKDD